MVKQKKDIEIKYFVKMKAPINLRREITIEAVEGSIITRKQLDEEHIDDFLQRIPTSDLKELIITGKISGKDWLGDYF